MGLLAKTRVALCRQRASAISRHDAFPSRVACLEDASDSHMPGGLGGTPPSARLLNHTASPLGGNLSGIDVAPGGAISSDGLRPSPGCWLAAGCGSTYNARRRPLVIFGSLVGRSVGPQRPRPVESFLLVWFDFNLKGSTIANFEARCVAAAVVVLSQCLFVLSRISFTLPVRFLPALDFALSVSSHMLNFHFTQHCMYHLRMLASESCADNVGPILVLSLRPPQCPPRIVPVEKPNPPLLRRSVVPTLLAAGGEPAAGKRHGALGAPL